jgi:tRNA-2-methylthio-N6-dimethylallyladenosine synthase
LPQALLRLCVMPSYAVRTFGCQMNKHDSIRMEEVLRGAGFLRAAEGVEADIIVLNTCSVRDKAEQKLRSEVGRLACLKRRRPELVLVVAGCMAEQEGRKLLAAFSAIDLVIGPDHVAELPELLHQVELGSPPLVRTGFDLDAPRFLTAPNVAASRPCAYVTTMKGCNERCSFCVVPFTRGPERYRASSEIVAEIVQLVASGVREVTLLGQTVNSYADPSRLLQRAPDTDDDDLGESEFAALLRRVAAEVPGLLRLRYEAPHPRHLAGSLMAAHRDLALLTRHVHMPVQSGSDAILRRMIRRHDRADFVARIRRLRAARPDLTISSDIIVGFPGETEDDFGQTLSLLDEVGFVGVFGFMYSPRPNTAALRLGDPVPAAVKAARLQRLFERSEALLGSHLRSLVGTRQRVLCEGPSKSRPEHPSGRTERNEIVHVLDAHGLDLVGELCEVEIGEALGHSLLGTLAPAERARLAERRPCRPEVGVGSPADGVAVGRATP